MWWVGSCVWINNLSFRPIVWNAILPDSQRLKTFKLAINAGVCNSLASLIIKAIQISSSRCKKRVIKKCYIVYFALSATVKYTIIYYKFYRKNVNKGLTSVVYVVLKWTINIYIRNSWFWSTLNSNIKLIIVIRVEHRSHYV